MSKRRLYTGAILILGLNQLIESIAFGIPYSYFPNYAISLGAPIASIGLFTSSFMFMSAILSPYFGSYSDRFGRKRLTVLGLIGDVIFGAMTGLCTFMGVASNCQGYKRCGYRQRRYFLLRRC